MDNLFPEASESTLTNLFMEPPSLADQRRIEAARFVSSSELDADMASQQADQMAQDSILRKAEDLITGVMDTSQIPTVAQNLEQLAVRQQAPSPVDTEVEMANTLSDEEDIAKAKQDYDTITSRRRNNIEAINTAVAEVKASPEWNTASVDANLQSRVEGTALEGVVRGARTAYEWVGELVIPGQHYLRIATVLSQFKPDFKFSDVLNMGQSMQELRTTLIDLPEEELSALLPDIMGIIKEVSGGSNVGAKNVLDDLLGELETNTKNGVDTAFAYLDILSVGLALKSTKAALKNKTVLKAGQGSVGGVSESSLASTAIKTKRGAAKLGAAANKGDDATLAAMGTTTENVVDDLLIPNLGDAPPSSTPYLPDIFLTEAEWMRASDKLVDRTNARLRAKMQVKINDSNFEYFDGGFNATMRIGLESGRGLKSEKAAINMARLNKMKNGEYTVVKSPDSEEYFIEVKQVYNFGKQDLMAYDEVLRNGKGFLGGVAGANTHFSAEIVNTANAAAIASANKKAVLRDALKDYTNLSSRKKVKVNGLLQENNGYKTMTRNEMIEKGLDDDQILAMESAYRVGRIHLMELNQLNRSRMVDNNIKVYKNGDQGEQFYAAEIDRNAFRPSARITDIETGKAIPFDDVRLNLDDYRLFRIMGEQGAPRFGVVRKSSNTLKVEELPAQVIDEIPGYISRRYDSPFYIVRTDKPNKAAKSEKAAEGGVDLVENETVMTAKSPDSAARAMEQLQSEFPDASFRVRRAQEVISQPTTWDELDALREAGLLRGTKRKPRIPDADDMANLRGVEESLDAMVDSASRSAGLSRWTDASIARWEATFGKTFGDFSVAAVPKHLETDLVTVKKWKEANDLRNHILMMNGMYESKLTGAFSATLNRIADGLYNKGLTSLGDELTGRKAVLTNAGKKAAGAMFLFLNPVRQAVMQMTMIPTYAGVNGGAKYMAGGYQKDWFDIMINRSGPMFEAWKKHGTAALVDDHIFKAGMSADSGFGLSGTALGGVGKVVEFSKKIGFDAGTYNDKLAQWLFSANRYKSMNGRMPSTDLEWKEVAAFGENLGLNMNSSDALLTQQGVFGLFTQFMSHSIKMTGRLLGKEGQFTAAEKGRMAGMTLLTYGTAGYGLNEAANRALTAFGVEMEPEEKQLFEEGLAGFMLDTMFSMWDNEDEETRLAFAQNFSPASGGVMGVTPNLISRAFNSTASLHHVLEALPFASDPAALGAGRAVTDAISTAKLMSTRTNATPSEITATTTAKFFGAFPAYSNFMRGMSAMRHGKITDAKGVPIMDISKGEAIARSFFGIRSKDERNLEQAMSEFYGMYTEGGASGMFGAVEKDAETTLSVLLPMFTKFADGEITTATLNEFLTKHQTAILDNFGEEHELRKFYMDRIFQGLERSGVTKSEKFAKQFERSVGKQITVRDARDILRRNPGPGTEQMIEWLNNTLQMRGE